MPITVTRDTLLARIRDGQSMSLHEQLRLTAVLSIPAIMAQLSTIIMQYIDAAMVGSLGADASASIGLMATSTWLFWGLCSSVATGFSVQVAHRIGAANMRDAQSVLRQTFLPALLFSAILMTVGVAISPYLPVWLGGGSNIVSDAGLYFAIFALSLPLYQISFIAGGMLRCSGNTLFPGVLNVVMCLLDVIFNFVLIFPTREVSILGTSITIYGADLGVAGAAFGTAAAEGTIGLIMLWYLCRHNSTLNLRHSSGPFIPSRQCLRRAFRIGAPLGGEHLLMCGAQVMITAIVAPLGTVAIAANAFAVTAESLCYMPGYGISEAATTLVGQCLGAKRQSLARRFATITVVSGVSIMTIMGIVMYFAAPFMMEIITPVESISSLGAHVLRIEAFAEPMFAASIVACGVFVGAGDTLVPSCMNLCSIWIVRLTLAALLAPHMGLSGVWIAMAVELCVRGIIFLVRLRTDRWMSAVL